VALRGWWIPAARRNARCVLVCHGAGANAGNFLSVAPFLQRAGFNVLLFDFRGHGDSGGHTTSFGYHEAQDVRAACKYLEARGQSRIALYGFSMGGSAVSQSFAARFGPAPSSVRAVVLDSTFAAFEPLAEAQFQVLPAWARTPALLILSTISRLEIGVAPRDIRPAGSIENVAPRPLLLIHGDADQLIAVSQAHRLFRAARQPKQIEIVPHAGHCLCRAANPARYDQAIVEALQKAL
jgi:pimeloyl-ACP methyl ester carboxylesterase